MLKGTADPVDLKHEAGKILSRFGSEIDELKERYSPFGINILNGIRVVDISYPVSNYPEKILSCKRKHQLFFPQHLFLV